MKTLDNCAFSSFTLMFLTRKRHFIIATQSSHNKRILLKIDDFVEQNSVFSERTKGKWLVTFIFFVIFRLNLDCYFPFKVEAQNNI